MEGYKNNPERKFDVWDGTESIYPQKAEEVHLAVSPESFKKAFLSMQRYFEKVETASAKERDEISAQFSVLVAEVKEKYSLTDKELKKVLLFNLIEGRELDENDIDAVDLVDGEFQKFIESI